MATQSEPRVDTIRVPIGSTGRWTWKVVHEENFLDAANSPTWARTLFIPPVTLQANKYLPYRVYERMWEIP
jgi:hypothetical protein